MYTCIPRWGLRLGLLRRGFRITRSFIILSFIPLRGRLIELIRRRGRIARTFIICTYSIEGNASRVLTVRVPYTPRVLYYVNTPWRAITSDFYGSMHNIKYDSWLPCAYPMEGCVYRVTTDLVPYNPNFWVTPGKLLYNPKLLACVFPRGEWVSDYYGEGI